MYWRFIPASPSSYTGNYVCELSLPTTIPLSVKGIRAMFEARGWIVTGEASDRQEAINLVQDLRPELALLDISMPVLNGLQAAKAIRAAVPSTKIVILSMHDSPHARQEALKAGAHGYVTKTAEPSLLFKTIDGLLKS